MLAKVWHNYQIKLKLFWELQMKSLLWPIGKSGLLGCQYNTKYYSTSKILLRGSKTCNKLNKPSERVVGPNVASIFKQNHAPYNLSLINRKPDIVLLFNRENHIIDTVKIFVKSHLFNIGLTFNSFLPKEILQDRGDLCFRVSL